MMPNHSLEQIGDGSLFQALISFWVFRSQPLLAAQLEH